MAFTSPKLMLAAGILGVASLSFVGVGGYAAFTSAVQADSTVQSGTFDLNVIPGKTGVNGSFKNDTQSSDSNIATCTAGGIAQNDAQFGSNGCFESSAANGIWQWGSGDNAPKFVLNPATADVFGHPYTNGFSLTLPNVGPGVAYATNFTVEDYGTLQGLVTDLTYAAPSSPNDLSNGSVIYVYQAAGSTQNFNDPTTDGQYSGMQGVAGCGTNSPAPSTVVGAQCYQGAPFETTDQWGHQLQQTNYWTLLGSTSASVDYTFKVVNGFVQPWYLTSSQSTPTPPGSEGGLGLKVVVAVRAATGNSAEGQSFSPTFSVNGTSLP